MCMLFISTILPITGSVLAGDEENPEMQDEENDLFGTFINFPNVLNFLQLLQIIKFDSFDFLDIESAWFYEELENPDYLFTAIKLKDLEVTPLRAIYAIHWDCNGKRYTSCLHTHSDGEYTGYVAGRIFGLGYRRGIYYDITGELNIDNNIIIFNIPKDKIGNPEPGDVLTRTDAWTGLRFVSELFTIPFGGELIKDWSGYGEDYIIQY